MYGNARWDSANFLICTYMKNMSWDDSGGKRWVDGRLAAPLCLPSSSVELSDQPSAAVDRHLRTRSAPKTAL
ncbi:hypothetical protein SAMD00023353_7600070 [Rosellinia necatrix]|uniref:Uncharacterized protein n=1 Tax=Rosellinia necatrix TaxID=77044 RepID=A0A1S8AAK3_ROSNE|nr:hypothetical protein SAMD00023353_7600070 [Rosellinia necatrix]